MLTSTTAIDDDSDDGDFLNVESPTAISIVLPTLANVVFSSRTISLYILRQADPSAAWKIQALFRDDLKFKFKATALTRPVVSLLNLVDIKHRVLIKLLHLS